MEMDIRGTKLNNLEFGDWVPQATQLRGLYHRALVENAAGAVPVVKRKRRAAVRTEEATEAVIEGCTQLGSSDGVGSEFTVQNITIEPHFHHTSPDLPIELGDDLKPANAKQIVIPVLDMPVQKENKCGRSKQGVAHNRRSRAKAPLDADVDIPDAFVHALFSKASMVPEPVDLLVRGTITMFLDERNHVHHLALEMKQVSI
jgi:hypothetical protein